MNQARADLRNAALCAAAVIAAVLLAWPVAEIAFADDWSYAFTVKRLAETGHILYNGWSSPSVLTQSYWGLLWVKPFGFSFTALRFSTLPFAAGAVALTYLLGRGAGLSTSFAIFAALLLGLSPLFLPLAASFMSDVPGLFCMLLSTYLLVRALDASPPRGRALLWITLGVIVGAIGGSSRQIVWLVPMGLLPYLAWLRRDDRALLAAIAVEWTVALATAFAIQAWFNRQPYSLPEPSVRSELIRALHSPGQFVIRFTEYLLTLLFLILPAATVVFVDSLRERRRVLTTAVVGALIALILMLRPHYALMPWMGNMITPWGVLGAAQISGDRPTILTTPVRAALSLGVFAVSAMLLASAISWLVDRQRMQSWLRSTFTNPTAARAAAAMLVIEAVGILALLLTRCALDVAYDRHVLPLIPCVAIPLLASYQNRGHRRLPLAAWALLGLFAGYAVASTQTVMSLSRARAAAAQRLADAGIPRQQISGGFEYDCWTELLISGHINEPRIRKPANAYQPGKGQTPDVQPRYRIEHQPTPSTAATDFGTVSYTTALPPFHRTISIDRLID